MGGCQDSKDYKMVVGQVLVFAHVCTPNDVIVIKAASPWVAKAFSMDELSINVSLFVDVETQDSTPVSFSL